MRKFLLLFIALLLSATAMAYDVEIDGIYYYLFSSDKTASVTSGANKYKGEVIIPSSIIQGGVTYEVTSIYAYAFNGSSDLTSVVIPSSITELGDYAFNDCTSLTSITIPKGVVYISTSTFDGCDNLQTIIYNAKSCYLKNALSGSFFQPIAKQITSITFGNEVEVIPPSLCAGMSKLTSVVIPENVKVIGSKAFANCLGLTTISLPDNLTSISNNSFYGTCVEDESNWDNGILYYDDYLINADDDIVSGDLKIKEGTHLIASNAFFYCENITSITFPEGLKYINSDAFYGCKSISTITLPSSIITIDEDAFAACSALTKVNYLGSVDRWVDINFLNQASNPIYNSHNLYINNELVTSAKVVESDSIKQYVFYGCNSLKSVEVGKNVEFVSPVSFLNCYNLDTVIWNAKKATYPNAYNYNESSPFYYLKDQIKSFKFGTDVEYIPKALCYGMSQITEIIVPELVKSIDSEVFNNCANLAYVEWNAKNCEDYSTEYKIMRKPFYECPSINEIKIGNNVEHLPAGCFYGVSSASMVTIGKGLKSVGDDCFYNCTGLEKVNYLGSIDEWVSIDFEIHFSNPIYYSRSLYINNELLCEAKILNAYEIKDYAFNYCESIKSVEVGPKINDIAQNSFRNCKNLTYVKWDARYCDDFASVNYAPFSFGTNVQLLEFGEEVKHIPAYLCSSLNALKLIVIPENVTSIGEGAFNGVEKLDAVYAYPQIVPNVEGNAFSNYATTLFVPCSAVEDYKLDDEFGKFSSIKCISIEEDTDILETLSDANITISNGLITCLDSDYHIYNTVGQDVTSLNGSLQSGIYVVAIGEDKVKVMVK